MVLIFSFCFLFADETIESFFQRVELQVASKNYVIYEGRKLISHKAYQKLKKREKDELLYHYVFYKGKPAQFRRLSEYGGITLYTQDGFYLEFYIRYHDHIMALPDNSPFYAICYLPKYNHCELLGREYN